MENMDLDQSKIRIFNFLPNCHGEVVSNFSRNCHVDQITLKFKGNREIDVALDVVSQFEFLKIWVSDNGFEKISIDCDFDIARQLFEYIIANRKVTKCKIEVLDLIRYWLADESFILKYQADHKLYQLVDIKSLIRIWDSGKFNFDSLEKLPLAFYIFSKIDDGKLTVSPYDEVAKFINNYIQNFDSNSAEKFNPSFFISKDKIKMGNNLKGADKSIFDKCRLIKYIIIYKDLYYDLIKLKTGKFQYVDHFERTIKIDNHEFYTKDIRDCLKSDQNNWMLSCDFLIFMFENEMRYLRLQ